MGGKFWKYTLVFSVQNLPSYKWEEFWLVPCILWTWFLCCQVTVWWHLEALLWIAYTIAAALITRSCLPLANSICAAQALEWDLQCRLGSKLSGCMVRCCKALQIRELQWSDASVHQIPKGAVWWLFHCFGVNLSVPTVECFYVYIHESMPETLWCLSEDICEIINAVCALTNLWTFISIDAVILCFMKSEEQSF